LGVIAREYEVQQLAQILQVVPPQSPIHGAMVKAIIEHMNVTSKEKLLEVVDQAGQPNPQAEQMQQQQMQAQMQLQQAQTAVLMAQAKEAEARAAKYMTEIDVMPKEMALKYSDMDKDGKVDDDFEKKIQLANMLMQEDKWQVEKEERQQNMQNKMGEQEMLQQMLQPQPQQGPPMIEEQPLQ
jgi:hypothetical protein